MLPTHVASSLNMNDFLHDGEFEVYFLSKDIIEKY